MEHRRSTQQHQKQSHDAADCSSNIDTKYSWKDRLLNKYGRSKRTWKDEMPFGDMATIIKIRYPQIEVNISLPQKS